MLKKLRRLIGCTIFAVLVLSTAFVLFGCDSPNSAEILNEPDTKTISISEEKKSATDEEMYYFNIDAMYSVATARVVTSEQFVRAMKQGADGSAASLTIWLRRDLEFSQAEIEEMNGYIGNVTKKIKDLTINGKETLDDEYVNHKITVNSDGLVTTSNSNFGFIYAIGKLSISNVQFVSYFEVESTNSNLYFGSVVGTCGTLSVTECTFELELKVSNSRDTTGDIGIGGIAGRIEVSAKITDVYLHGATDSNGMIGSGLVSYEKKGEKSSEGWGVLSGIIGATYIKVQSNKRYDASVTMTNVTSDLELLSKNTSTTNFPTYHGAEFVFSIKDSIFTGGFSGRSYLISVNFNLTGGTVAIPTGIGYAEYEKNATVGGTVLGTSSKDEGSNKIVFFKSSAYGLFEGSGSNYIFANGGLTVPTVTLINYRTQLDKNVSGDTLTIKNANDFQAAATFFNYKKSSTVTRVDLFKSISTIKLENDVVLNSSFVPFGLSSANPFDKTFDGNGKSIAFSNTETFLWISVFGYTASGAVIRNLQVTLPKTAETADTLNGFIGVCTNTTVENVLVRFNGTITTNGVVAQFGALVCELKSGSTLRNCVVVFEGGTLIPRVGTTNNMRRFDIGKNETLSEVDVRVLLKKGFENSWFNSDARKPMMTSIYEQENCSVDAVYDSTRIRIEQTNADTSKYDVVVGKENSFASSFASLLEDFDDYKLGSDNITNNYFASDKVVANNKLATKQIYYLYQVKELTIKTTFDGTADAGKTETITLHNNTAFKFAYKTSGSDIRRTYDVENGSVFYGFNGIHGASCDFTLTDSNDVLTVEYFSVPTFSAFDSITKENFSKKDYDGRVVELATSYVYNGANYTVENTVKKSGSNVTEYMNVGEYTVSYTFKVGGAAYSGTHTYTFEIEPKEITIKPVDYQGKKQDGKNIDETTLQYQILHFAGGEWKEIALVDGNSLTVNLRILNNDSKVGDDYVITEGVLECSTSNYVLVFWSESAIKYSIYLEPIYVVPIAGQGKVYDGTSAVNITYLVYEDEGRTVQITSVVFTGSLYIGNNKDVGTYLILRNNLMPETGFNAILLNEYFEITQKSITVTPIATEFTYNGKVAINEKSVEYSAPGLENGDSLSGALSIGDNIIDVGVYDILIGTLSNSNYKITFVEGIKFSIKMLEIFVTPTSGQTMVYCKELPTLIQYGISPSYQGVTILSGSLAIESYNAGMREILIGTLVSDNPNCFLTLVGDVKYTITQREVSIVYFRDTDLSIPYLPMAGHNTALAGRVEGLIGGDIAQPLFDYEVWKANESKWAGIGFTDEKMSVGLYRASLVKDAQNMSNPNYIYVGSMATIYFEVTPYMLTKEDFDFDVLTTTYNEQQINYTHAAKNQSLGWDYPNVNMLNNWFVDPLNYNSSSMLNGIPVEAGNYIQYSSWSFDGNYTCADLEGAKNGVFTFSRNVIVKKAQLTINITYNDSMEKQIAYQAKNIPVNFTISGGGIFSNITLQYRVELEGTTLSYIKQAGTYVVTFSFTPESMVFFNKNYCLSDGTQYDESVFKDTFTVLKANPKISNVTASTISYEDPLMNSVIKASVVDALGFGIPDGVFSFENPTQILSVGTTVVWYTYTPSTTYEDQNQGVKYLSNYNSVRGQVAVKVVPREIIITPVSKQSQSYNGGLNEIRFNTSVLSDTTAYRFVGNLGVTYNGDTSFRGVSDGYVITRGSLVMQVKAGDKWVDTSDYLLVLSGNVGYSIVKAKLEVAYDGFDNLSYNAPFDMVVTIIGAVAGETYGLDIKLSKLNGHGGWASVDNVFGFHAQSNANLDAGSYLIQVKIESNNYYLDAMTSAMSFYVDRQNINAADFKVARDSFTYDGTVKALELDTTHLPSVFVVNYKNNFNIQAGSYQVDMYISATNENYYIDGTPIDSKTPFYYSGTLTINQFVIGKVEVENADELYYNGKAIELSLLFDGKKIDDTLNAKITSMLNGKEAAVKNVGTYNISVTIIANPNYAFDSNCETEFEIVIKPCELIVAANEKLVKIFNETAEITLNPSQFDLIGVINGETVTLVSLSGLMVDLGVGFERKVELVDYVLAGADKDNYIIKLSACAVVVDVVAKIYADVNDNSLSLTIVPIVEGAIPLTATVKSTVYNNSDYAALKTQLKNSKQEIGRIFSFTVYDGDDVFNLTNPIEIRISQEGNDHVMLYKLNEDGSFEAVEFEIVEGFICFVVDSYSTFFTVNTNQPVNLFAKLFSSPITYVVLFVLVGALVGVIVIRNRRRVEI